MGTATRVLDGFHYHPQCGGNRHQCGLLPGLAGLDRHRSRLCHTLPHGNGGNTCPGRLLLVLVRRGQVLEHLRFCARCPGLRGAHDGCGLHDNSEHHRHAWHVLGHTSHEARARRAHRAGLPVALLQRAHDDDQRRPRWDPNVALVLLPPLVALVCRGLAASAIPRGRNRARDRSGVVLDAGRGAVHELPLPGGHGLHDLRREAHLRAGRKGTRRWLRSSVLLHECLHDLRALQRHRGHIRREHGRRREVQ
mmetsp:Transcript_77682/g.251380  ORF Transcript_77682/g.251380 Transcript_77682/m.251380 type:complete len:251 (+) Transcript_77682:346-1098(+)